MKKKGKKNHRWIGVFTLFLCLLLFSCLYFAFAKEGEPETENNYWRNISVDLAGGTSYDIDYGTIIDRDGNGWTAGTFNWGLLIGETVIDRTGSEHKVEDHGADTPCFGTFTFNGDAIGVTPYVLIAEPTRDGYIFSGWSVSIDGIEIRTDIQTGYTAFNIGPYSTDGSWNSSHFSIVANWEPIMNSMTISWDSGVNYVTIDDNSVTYSTSGESHSFPCNTGIQTNAYIKDGYDIIGFQEDAVASGFVWTDWWKDGNYPGVVFDSWYMDGSRSIKVLTNTTFAAEFDDGFENANYSKTVQTDSTQKDYIKLKDGYEFDYVEDNDGNKWYDYDGSDESGNYCSWKAYKPRTVTYHSKKANAAYTIRVNPYLPSEFTTAPVYSAIYNGNSNSIVEDDGWVKDSQNRYTKTFTYDQREYLPAMSSFYKYTGYDRGQGWKLADGTYVSTGWSRKNLSSTEGDIIDIYPNLSPKDLYINFDGNGGTVNMPSYFKQLHLKYDNYFWYENNVNQQVRLNFGDNMPVTASKPGYIFTGWTIRGTYFVNSTMKIATANTRITSSNPTTAIARYEPITYTVRLHIDTAGDGASYVINKDASYDWTYNESGKYFERELTYDATQDFVRASAVVSAAGYNLIDGWYTQDGKNIFDGYSPENDKTYEEVWNLTATGGQIIDLYAKWNRSTSTYKVNHLLQNIGDDNYTLKESAEYTETINESVTPTVKTYTGFTSPAAQTVQVKGDGTTVVNYYYTRNSYLLTVSAGTGIGSVTVSNSAGLSNIENTDKKKILSVRYGASVTINADISPGYSWLRWDGSFTQTEKSYSFEMPANEQTLTARATAGQVIYKVNYLLQNIGDDNYTLKETAEETGTTDTYITPTVKTYTGFTSPAAQTVQVKGDGTTVVNYYYTRNSYLLTVNAGTGITSVSVLESSGMKNIEDTDKKKIISVRYGASVTINADISPGYSWSKWDGSFTQWNKSYSFYMPANAVNVTARATANKYVVQLYANKPSDTSNLVVNKLSDSEWVYDNTNGCYTSTFTYDEAKNIPSPADTYSLKGYSVSGWYTSATGGNNVFFGNMKWNLTTSYNGVVKLYARWTENEYRISFNYVKPDNASGDIQNNEIKEKNVKYNKPVGNLPEPTLTGWKFDGWYTAVTGGTKFTSDTKYLNTENIVLYPHWTANKYTITFDSNKPAGSTDSVTGSMSNIYCTYDVPVQIPDNNFTLRGWDFVAWNTKADGSGIRYLANDTVSNLTSTDGATVTLYAEWDTHIEWNASLSKANKSFINAMELSFEDKAVNWPDGIGYGIVMNNTLTYKEFGDMQGFLNVNISNVYPKSIKYEFSDSRINEVVLNDRAYELTKINGKSTFEFMIDSSLTRGFVQNISFTLPEYEAESDVISDKEYSAYVDISVTYQIYSTNREVTETRRVYYNVVELDLSKIHSRIRYQPGQVR